MSKFQQVAHASSDVCFCSRFGGGRAANLLSSGRGAMCLAQLHTTQARSSRTYYKQANTHTPIPTYARKQTHTHIPTYARKETHTHDRGTDRGSGGQNAAGRAPLLATMYCVIRARQSAAHRSRSMGTHGCLKEGGKRGREETD